MVLIVLGACRVYFQLCELAWVTFTGPVRWSITPLQYFLARRRVVFEPRISKIRSRSNSSISAPGCFWVVETCIEMQYPDCACWHVFDSFWLFDLFGLQTHQATLWIQHCTERMVILIWKWINDWDDHPFRELSLSPRPETLEIFSLVLPPFPKIKAASSSVIFMVSTP